MNHCLDNFKKYLSETIAVNENEWEKFANVCSIRQYKTSKIFYGQGEVFNDIMLICDGLARSYLIDNQGREFTWSFYCNDSIPDIKNLMIVDYESFIQSKPTELTFEVLREITVIVINKRDLESLYLKSHYWANVGRILSEIAYCITHQRALSLLTKSAKERYVSLINENPSFLQHVSQYYIASYLGITPQSLSRLKKEVKLPYVND